jgi:hypothetical protein
MYLTKNVQENCVMARVIRQKKLHQRDFSLKEFGTWEKALRAARHWLRKILPTLPPRTYPQGVMTSRNHSGVVGVHWSPGLVKKANGKVYECPKWIAKWPGCRLSGGISWMEKQFEHEGAFVLAVLSRHFKTTDRDWILKKFECLHGTREYSEIAAKMRM